MRWNCTPNTRGGATINVVIVQHYAGTVNQYVTAAAASLADVNLGIPDHCPYPQCQAPHSLIRWGSYQRGALLPDQVYLIRIQRLRCKVCGRTHSLLPDFLHPHRHYVIELLQDVVFLYLIKGLGLGRLLARLPRPGAAQSGVRGPARSTVREWIRSFAYGAGELLLGRLLRHLLSLEPGAHLPEAAPDHLKRIRGLGQRRRLQQGCHFWLLAEYLYALVKNRLPKLHFAAGQLLPFMLHWLQNQALPPRLFWSPTLPHTPTTPF